MHAARRLSMNIKPLIVAPLAAVLITLGVGCATNPDESPNVSSETTASPGEWRSVPLDPATGGITTKERKGCRGIYYSSSTCLAVTVCCDDGCGEQTCYGACGGQIGGC